MTRYLFLLLILFLLIVFVTGCLDLAGSCETEVSRRIFSPDRKLQALTLTTDCGATTSTSYGVRIVEGSDTTDEGVREDTILGSNNGVGIEWLSNDTLLISDADTVTGFTMKNQLELKEGKTKITILYK